MSNAKYSDEHMYWHIAEWAAVTVDYNPALRYKGEILEAL